MLRLRLLSLTAVVAGLVLGLGTLVIGEHSAESAPEDDIETALLAAISAWNNNDFATLAAAFTDDGLRDQFGITDRDQAEALLAEAFAEAGPIPSLIDQVDDVTLSDVVVNGNDATGIVQFAFLSGFDLYEEWQFTFLEGGWKIGAGKAVTRPIPEGVTAVDLFLDEYQYRFDQAAVAGGNFAFNVQNVGEELHEVVVFKLNTDASLPQIGQALLAGGADTAQALPPGVEFLTFAGLYEPNDKGTGLFNDMLEAGGRYLLVCFVSSPSGPTHAALGMAAEFTVEGGGSTATQSTDESGIAGDGSERPAWVLAALGLLFAGSVAAFAVWRDASFGG